MIKASKWVLIWTCVCFPSAMIAAQIGDLSETSWQEQALRFLSFEDTSVRYAVVGSMLMGLSCGLLGAFIVVRRMALFGDTLSHAVLPGVALGFMWHMSKDPLSLLIGATVAGLLGTTLVSVIRDTTHLKEDTVLGMVLAGFYAIGACLMGVIQRLPSGNKAGLDKFMFGQAAALGSDDIVLVFVVTLVSIGLFILFYKEYLILSFDAGFARSIGLPVKVLHYVMMLLLSFAVVVSLQAVGVVLVSAMLITPASAAYLLTDRLHYMVILAAVFGMLAGALGSFISFLGHHLPTGPFIVLSATFLFVLAWLFAPRHGYVIRKCRAINRKRIIRMENTLKAIFHIREASGFEKEGVTLHELEQRRNEPLTVVQSEVDDLVKSGHATLSRFDMGDYQTEQRELYLTPSGWERACEIVRNHRLWELYLTYAADYPEDHVHEDAEVIEHILGDSTVQQLEKRLNYPSKDPHGKLIPGVKDIRAPELPTRHFNAMKV